MRTTNSTYRVNAGSASWHHGIGALLSFSLISLMLVAITPATAAGPVCSSEPVGLIGSAPSVGGTPVALDVEGNYAYVGDFTSHYASRGTFQVFDITDPCDPIRLPGDLWLSQELNDIEVIGDLAYFANDANGFVVYDISDPTSPTYVEGRRDGSYADTLEFHGGRYAYMAYSYTSGRELAIYDMDTFPGAGPAATFDALGNRHAHEVDVVGDRAYLISANGPGFHFEVVDISNPTSPSRIGSLLFPALFEEYGYPWDIEVRDGYAYVATNPHNPAFRQGLVVIDLTDEATPTLLSFLHTPSPYGVWGHAGLDVVDDHVYMAAESGFKVIDVSDPANPVMVEEWDYPAEFDQSKGGAVMVRGHLAFVTSFSDSWLPETGGLAIYKLYDPVIEVDVDIKPGSDTNPINLKSKGVIPVAILTTEDFDAAAVAPLTVRFGPALAEEAHGTGHLSDVDDDGDIDLMLHFRTQDTGIGAGGTEACLVGETLEGQGIEGCDTITVKAGKTK